MNSSITQDNDSEQGDGDAAIASRLAHDESNQDTDCSSDATLAILLQRQYDIEYNRQLKREESRINGHSKVGVSFGNLKRTPTIDPENFEFLDEELDDWFDDTENNCDIDPDLRPEAAWDAFEKSDYKQKSRMMGRSGFVLDHEGNMITKHDIPTSSRKNVCRLMESKTDIKTGDAGAIKDDFMLTNYVYNQLAVHSRKNTKKATQRLLDKKERETSQNINELQNCKFDGSTKAIMDSLLMTLKVEKFNGVIGHGKESTIIHAIGCDHHDNPGQELAVKIFRSDANFTFKTRNSYNKSKCPSYKFDKPRSKNDSLKKWAERGFKNLRSLRRAEINCPEAISLKKHVMIMSFLGSYSNPAPKLKETKLDDAQLKESYDQVIDIMRRMYQECDLIHGDLSEYNLLWHKNQIFVIDVSQSMSSSHPAANRFLYRDCKNILDFYSKSGLTDTLDINSLFAFISGKDIVAKDVEQWCKIEDFPPNEKLMHRENDMKNGCDATDTIAQMLNMTEVNDKVSISNT